MGNVRRVCGADVLLMYWCRMRAGRLGVYSAALLFSSDLKEKLAAIANQRKEARKKAYS
jgi:hypothetical protein